MQAIDPKVSLLDLRLDEPAGRLHARIAVQAGPDAWGGGVQIRVRAAGRPSVVAGLYVSLAPGATRTVHIALPGLDLPPWTREKPRLCELHLSLAGPDGRPRNVLRRRLGLPLFRARKDAAAFRAELRAAAPGLDEPLEPERARPTVRAVRRAGLAAIALPAGAELSPWLDAARELGCHVLITVARPLSDEDLRRAARQAAAQAPVLAWLLVEPASRAEALRVHAADPFHPVLVAREAQRGAPRPLARLQPGRKSRLEPLTAADGRPLLALALAEVAAPPMIAPARRKPTRALERRARAALRRRAGSLENALAKAFLADLPRRAAFAAASGPPVLAALPALTLRDGRAAGVALRRLDRALPAEPPVALSLSAGVVYAGERLEVRLPGPPRRVRLTLDGQPAARARTGPGGTAAFTIPATLAGPRAGLVASGSRRTRTEQPVLALPAPDLRAFRICAWHVPASTIGPHEAAPVHRLGRVPAGPETVLLLAGERLARRPSEAQARAVRALLGAGAHVLALGLGRLAPGWLPFSVEVVEVARPSAAVHIARLEGSWHPLPAAPGPLHFLRTRIDPRRVELVTASATCARGADGRMRIHAAASGITVRHRAGRATLLTGPFGALWRAVAAHAPGGQSSK
jgi:hypothetical protein